jgi:hypothetical protein
MRGEAAHLVLWLACAACGADDHVAPLLAASEPHGPGGATSSAWHDAGEWSPPVVSPPAPGSDRPFWLSETGLYRDIQHKQVAPDLIEFEPTYALWSDGAQKRRWLRLPAGERIDTSDMDHWLFPIGSMLFKQFATPDGKLLETRLIMRRGPGADDYFMGAFLWNDAETDARFVPAGAQNVRDTEHNLPRSKLCATCHNGEAGRILGLSAVQGERLPAERFTHAQQPGYRVPGDETTAQALGYLHANCGNCHNLRGTAWSDTDLDLRLSVGEITPQETAIQRSVLNVAMTDQALGRLRVLAGEPNRSGVYTRMSSREAKKQMPPFATERVDDRGLVAVAAWIESLR